MTTWTNDPQEIAALDTLRATFATIATGLHAAVAEAPHVTPAGGHYATP